MTSRVCVITAGHLSTCPRMLKAADALAGAGYRVRVVSTRHVDWATATDAEVYQKRAWAWRVVSYDRATGSATYFRSGVRYRLANRMARLLGPAHCPLGLAARAYSRVHPELVRAALEEPADLVYGGTTGALAAVAVAARRAGVPYALDLEDFHSAEQEDGPTARLAHGLAERVERGVLAGARFLTTSSAAIAEAYREKYQVRPLVINNTFPLPASPPDVVPPPGDRLRLYWFSQTIGPHRGLEDVIRAMGVARLAGELHLRGRPVPGYLDGLAASARHLAPGLEVVHHPPGPPDAMVDLARGYDIGLALEHERVFNRSICLTNKAFTYVLAGLAVAFTDTPGQRALARDLGEGAILYPPGDAQTLAGLLKRWADDRPQLARARAAAWEAARRRWHWEHPEESGLLLRAVAAALE